MVSYGFLQYPPGFTEINRDQKIEPSPHAAYQKTGATSVVLNLATETYYGLDETSTRFWELMVEFGAFGTVLDQMLREFEVEPELLERDLTRLIAQLEDFNLVEIDTGADEERSA